jgi:CRISPR-associated protein Cas1
MPGDERVVEIERPGVYVRVSNDRLRVEEDRELLGEVPLVDLAALILSSPNATLSRAVLDAVTQHGGSVVVCNSEHQPTAMLLPLIGHHAQTQRLIAQANASRPTVKRLWKQIVQAKIRSQAAHLAAHTGSDAGLFEIARQVRSGDPGNVEGWAAQRYWPKLLGPRFRRRRDGPPPNALLNYGYAVLRAGVARSLAASGLHPSLGLNHRGRNNPLCLADDLMEPFRPLVDRLMLGCEQYDDPRPGAEARRQVAAILSQRVEHAGEFRSVTDWLGRAAASLAQIVLGNQDDLLLPKGLADVKTYQ